MHSLSNRCRPRPTLARVSFTAVSMCLGILILSTSMTSAFQSSFYTRIVGQVGFPPGESRLPDLVRVVLSSSKGSVIEERVVSADASFSFQRLRWGQYMITVSSPGYRSSTQQVDIAPRTFEVRVLVPLGRRIEDQSGNQPESGNETVTVETLIIPPKALKEMKKARERAGNGQVEKAIRHFENARKLCSGCYQAYEELGLLYAAEGRWPDAAETFRESIAEDPRNPAARRRLAEIYLRQKEFDRALAELEEADSLEAENSQTVSLQGEAYLGLGNCPIALDHFRRAAQINPENRSYLGLGRSYYCTGRTTEALAEFKAFVERRPSDPRSDAVRSFIAELEKALESRRD